MASHDASDVPADPMAKLCNEMEEVKEIMVHNLESVHERGDLLHDLEGHTKQLHKTAGGLNEKTGGAHHEHHRSAAAEHVKELIDQVDQVEQVMEKNLERLHERGERLEQLEETLAKEKH